MEDMTDELLSGLSELVYVSDVETYELLYLNKPGLKLFGSEGIERGDACYRVLQGREEPCPFCTNSKLSFDAFYEWEHTNEVTKQHYLLRDKLVSWRGRMVRLEVAFDVTEQVNERAQYRFLAEAGNMAIACVKVLEKDGDIGVALNEVLGMLGAFLEADRTYMFRLRSQGVSNTHEWCKDGVASQIQILQDIPSVLIDYWLEQFSLGRAVIIESVADLAEDRGDERETLSDLGIESLVAAPIEINGDIVGFLGADNPKREGLNAVETPLMGLAYFVSTSVKRAIAQRKVDELTWYDTLTQTRSRAAFHRDFDQGAFAGVGFALVDADRLSVINREQGRAVGDEVLCSISSCLHEVFGDTVYRIGDDEFCSIAADIDYKQFAQKAESAMQLLLDKGLPASLGSAWNEKCTDTIGLLDLAGERMRSAKRGRHRAIDLGVDLASDAAVSNLLRPGGAQEAVESGMFTVCLMPQSSGETGRIIAAEALIRYHNPLKGLQALPASFVPALEDMGEISAIDFFALSEACATVSRWQQQGKDAIPLAVNFSRCTIGDAGFVERVAKTVAFYGIDPSFIEIEITESTRERSDELLRSVINGLRSKGFRVAIDDFGVENANFSLFIQLAFDVLKIDKSLVWGLGVEERTMQVIRGLVTLCNDLGIETIAEGIETEEQHDALREAGCTRAQGYRIGKPCSIAEFEQRFLCA
ncbi:MAG: sensor domain-containing phosphodiesterase [Gordonibacter sp.]